MADRNRKRTHNISFRATADEQKFIESKRALTGMSLRAFIMECIRKKPLAIKPGAELVAGQIARAGNNLNQIARHLNSGFLPRSCGKALEEIRDELTEIRRTWL